MNWLKPIEAAVILKTGIEKYFHNCAKDRHYWRCRYSRGNISSIYKSLQLNFIIA